MGKQMNYSYSDVTAAAAEAIADMCSSQDEPSAPLRAVGAGVYLLWAHLVGDAARQDDDDRIVRMVDEIR